MFKKQSTIKKIIAFDRVYNINLD